jgi:hypothetical protein
LWCKAITGKSAADLDWLSRAWPHFFCVIPQRKQPKVPKSLPFPCVHAEKFRSKERPTSVHQLQPGDIDIVAAMGDSLTAGVGAVATNVLSILYEENRGMSWSIGNYIINLNFIWHWPKFWPWLILRGRAGGQSTWREYLTLPNILKNFNANVTGYSVGDGHSESRSSRFNVAVNGAMDQDMEFAAATLVRRMQADHTIDFQNDWKVSNRHLFAKRRCLMSAAWLLLIA